jgi:hypothetical protein
MGKLKKTREVHVKDILQKDSDPKDEVILGEFLELNQNEDLVFLITESHNLVILDGDLKNIFQLDLKDPLAGCSFLKSCNSMYLSFKNGKAMVFNLSSLKFTQIISKETVPETSALVFKNFLNGDFSRVLKSMFFECSYQNEEDSLLTMLVGVFTFRNRKTRILFISDLLESPSLQFKELGEFQSATCEFHQNTRTLLLGTAEGDIRVYRIRPSSREALLIRKFKPHMLPIRSIICKDLLPGNFKKKISTKDDPKLGEELHKTRELERFKELVVWSFSVDYSVSMTSVDLNTTPTPFYLHIRVLGLLVFVLSLVYYLWFK